MKVYHVVVEEEDGWYCVRALEDPGIFSQARSFDEIIANVREVASLLRGEENIQIELVVPPGVTLHRTGRRHAFGGRETSRRRKSAAVRAAKPAPSS